MEVGCILIGVSLFIVTLVLYDMHEDVNNYLRSMAELNNAQAEKLRAGG